MSIVRGNAQQTPWALFQPSPVQQLDNYTGQKIRTHPMEERKTRSSKTFSPYAIHTLAGGSGNFSLESALMSAVQREDVDEEAVGRAAEKAGAMLDHPPDAEGPTPLSFPTLGSGNHGTETSNSTGGSTAGVDASSSKKRRLHAKKDSSHARRKRMRALQKEDEDASSMPSHAGPNTIRPNISARYSNEGPRVQCHTSGEPRVASTGFVGLNKKKDPQATREYTLAEVTGSGSELNFELKEWDGSTPTVIVDQSGRVIAVLAGWPDDPDWTALQSEAAAALEASRPQCVFSEGQLTHRRGQFYALNCGVSFGGGQRRPMNLKNNDVNKRVVENLCSMDCFKRIAGFGSGVMKHRAPKIYDAYVDNLNALCDQEARQGNSGDRDDGHEPLKRPFPSSVFSASTFNMGPRTVCLKHADFGNLAFGWCAVSSLGSFDYKRGGHLILWECRLVIEFPPGATILLPSAVITHSNVAVGPEERRYSFTQYTASGLFRWVANNFQTASRHQAQLTSLQRQQRVEEDLKRWSLGLALWPKVSCNGCTS